MRVCMCVREGGGGGIVTPGVLGRLEERIKGMGGGARAGERLMVA
jgi:hypothetical protein